MHKNTVFSLVNMEVEAFEQTLSLQKDEDGGFCKNTSYWYSWHIMARNKGTFLFKNNSMPYMYFYIDIIH